MTPQEMAQAMVPSAFDSEFGEGAAAAMPHILAQAVSAAAALFEQHGKWYAYERPDMSRILYANHVRECLADIAAMVYLERLADAGTVLESHAYEPLPCQTFSTLRTIKEAICL